VNIATTTFRQKIFRGISNASTLINMKSNCYSPKIRTANLKSCKERKQLIALIRHQGNLEPALNGASKPKRVMPNAKSEGKHCNGFFKRKSISRHLKKCYAKPEGVSTTVAETIIYSASMQKHGDYISKMAVKDIIFVKMRADERSQVAISDLLIAEFAEFKLKSKKEEA